MNAEFGEKLQACEAMRAVKAKVYKLSRGSDVQILEAPAITLPDVEFGEVPPLPPLVELPLHAGQRLDVSDEYGFWRTAAVRTVEPTRCQAG